MPTDMDSQAPSNDAFTRLSLWLKRKQADLIAILLVFIAYAITIWVAFQSTVLFAVFTAVANTIPVVILGMAVRHILITKVIGKSAMVQTAWHAALCAIFSISCYWLLLVFLGVANSPSLWNFQVRPFVIRGSAWQMLENVTTYALVATLSYLQAARTALQTQPLPTPVPTPAVPKEPIRLLVRKGDELRPVDVDRIVSITGADDYAELSTLDGKHLVTMTLAEFETTLDPARFVRVHRSRIVNLDFVDRAEPAGAGRLLLHMRTGEKVSTSRTGAQLLKSLVI
jgi:two-component system, LytTR family, response regulator